MAIYHCRLVMANEDEWLKHVDDVVERNNNAEEYEKKSDEELVVEACKFDFKWDTILDFIEEN